MMILVGLVLLVFWRTSRLDVDGQSDRDCQEECFALKIAQRSSIEKRTLAQQLQVGCEEAHSHRK